MHCALRCAALAGVAAADDSAALQPPDSATEAEMLRLLLEQPLAKVEWDVPRMLTWLLRAHTIWKSYKFPIILDIFVVHFFPLFVLFILFFR